MADRIIESLSFNIESISDNAISSLERAYKSIGKLEKNIKKIQEVNLSGITSKFNTMANAINKFENVSEQSLVAMSNMAKSFSSINSLIKNVSNADMDKLGKQFKQLNVAINPFLRTLQMNQPLLADFAKTLDLAKVIGQYDKLNAQAKLLNERTNTQVQKTQKEAINREKANTQLKIANERLANLNNKQTNLNKKSTFWTNLWKIGKLGYAVRVFTRIGNSLARITQLSADFDESLNKFQSATQEYYYDAIKFANNLSDSFGLAKATILDYQSTFMNMLNALEGLGEGVANQLSQNLTIMAIDYASLFNTSIEQAMNSFQSMLSGRTMAIRTTSGIDVTDNTIYEYYKELGGTKTKTALTQLEKRLLRILAVYQQMNASFAVSDYAETIENFSNQARILKEQIQELGTWIGNLTIRYLEPAMRYFNAFIITLKEVTKALAITLGYKEQKPKDSILGAIENEASSATDALEELESTLGLLSIDKFEVLGGSKKSLSGVSGDLSLIQNELNKEMEKLQKSMEGITYQAKEISENILSWLGYIEQVNPKTGEVFHVLEEGYTTIEKIGNILKSIVLTITSLKLVSFIKSLDLLNKQLFLSQKALTAINGLALFGLIYSLTTLISQWDELNGIQKLFYTSIIALSSIMFIFTNKDLVLLIRKLSLLGATLTKAQASMISFSMAGVMVGASLSWLVMMNNFDKKTQSWVGCIMLLVGAFTALAVSIMAVQGLMTWGTAIPILLGSLSAGAVGITSLIKGSKQINGYATGGFPEQGEIFVARERGPELVGSMGGRTTVANNMQIVDGIKQGVKEAMQESRTSNNNGKIEIGIDRSVNGNALARALLPFIKAELKRDGGGINI